MGSQLLLKLPITASLENQHVDLKLLEHLLVEFTHVIESLQRTCHCHFTCLLYNFQMETRDQLETSHDFSAQTAMTTTSTETKEVSVSISRFW